MGEEKKKKIKIITAQEPKVRRTTMIDTPKEGETTKAWVVEIETNEFWVF